MSSGKLHVSIHHLPINEVFHRPGLLRRLRELTLWERSGMNRFLNRFANDHHVRTIRAKALLAFHSVDILGWSLVTWEDDCVYFLPSVKNEHQGNVCSHVYVDPNFRRLGIGTALIHRARQLTEPNVMRVYHYDSPEFFDPIMKELPSIQRI